MARLGVSDALLRLQRAAVSSGEPQRVMAAFLAERANRKKSSSKPAKRKGA